MQPPRRGQQNSYSMIAAKIFKKYLEGVQFLVAGRRTVIVLK